ncbi:nucleotide exchange factor GrpE [Marisediminicola sp. LYQ134]|uniref:nucleotide exchange factor GrpE n=1 Tax=Marisediminicola sp. LYQ134 TaxID=3391061 RepID=UPI0039832A35
MADTPNEAGDEPVVRDNRRIDPETGEVRSSPASGGATDAESTGVPSEDGDTADIDGGAEDLIQAEDADVETSLDDAPPAGAVPLSEADQAMLDDAERDLVADMRTDMLRAQAELVNFRNRVERDRAANRDAVIAEVIRTLLPAMDDLTRAETHGDLEGSPLALVAQKLRGGFEKYGLRSVGVKGEPFDPNFHEALVQLPSPDVTTNTVADVIEPGYALGDRLIRAAKVAVHVPAE